MNVFRESPGSWITFQTWFRSSFFMFVENVWPNWGLMGHTVAFVCVFDFLLILCHPTVFFSCFSMTFPAKITWEKLNYGCCYIRLEKQKMLWDTWNDFDELLIHHLMRHGWSHRMSIILCDLTSVQEKAFTVISQTNQTLSKLLSVEI